MKTTAQLNKKFDSLNKKYIAIDKKMSKLAKTEDTLLLSLELEKIQEQMTIIANQLENK